MKRPRPLRALAADGRGVSAVTTAVALGAVLGVLALGLDGAEALRLHGRLQASADAAALAGASALAAGEPAEPGIRALAAANAGTQAVTLRSTVAPPNVTVALESSRELLFPRLLGLGRMRIAAEATATLRQLGPACLLAIGAGAQPITGLGLARLEGCTSISAADGLSPSRLAALDPFATLAEPPLPCRPGTHVVSSRQDLGPGMALPARCGGVRVAAGGLLRLSGGAFRLAGPLEVEAGGALQTDEAVLLVGTHPVHFAPGAGIALMPPRAGPHAGVVLRGAPAGTAHAVSRLRAGAGQSLGGALVLPAQTVEIAGNASACGLLVAKAIRIAAPTTFSLACKGGPLPAIMAADVRLAG